MFKNLRALHTLIVTLLCSSLLVSCFDNEEIDYTTYNDCILSAISFGTIPRTVHTINSTTKKDSTYESTVTAGSVYPFTIDLVNDIAYNLDSLPYGCHADKIIFSTFTVSNGSTSGTASVRKLTEDVDTVYSTADTLDFSKGKRYFTLYGYDGSTRPFTVEVRIHQQDEDSLIWNQMNIADWNAKNIVSNAGLNSFDVSPYHFRLENGKMMVSTDGENYEEDSVAEADKAELPTANYAWATGVTRADENMFEVLLYGTVTKEDSLESRVWRRVIDTTDKYHYAWDYLPATEENNYPAKALHDAYLLSYDKGYLLVGIDAENHISLKYSLDGGRIWKDHEILVLPDDLAEKTVTTLSAGVDEHSNLWLLIDGNEVWFGRACKVDWAEAQKIFLN